MASNLIQDIVGDPPRILSIGQGRVVDDEATIDGVQSQTRFFNVITTETRQELTVYDVFEQCPQFVPGFTIGKVPNRRRLNNVRLRETEATSVYELECEFVPFDYKTPFFVPIDWRWESTIIEIPAYVDVNGKPIVTTAGEPIVGQVRRLKAWVISGTRNVPGVPKWFKDYGVSVNKDKVKLDGELFAPNTLQLQKISLGGYETQTIGKTEYRYRPLSFEFWFNPLTWSTQVLNLGYNELNIREYVEEDPETGQKKKRRELYSIRATDAAGDETKNRVFLDKNGQQYRDENGKPRVELSPKEIVVLKFDLDEALPYDILLK